MGDTTAKVKTWEVVAGDQTGVVTLRLISEEHAKVCEKDASIRVQNARVLMRSGANRGNDGAKSGFIRVIIDTWGVLKPADSPLAFEVKSDHDVSSTEYELTG